MAGSLDATIVIPTLNSGKPAKNNVGLPELDATIVIPTLNREDSLNVCLSSLSQQTCQTFSTLVLTERGDLAALRNQGLRRAPTPVVCFLDDDIYCPPTWLAGVLQAFRDTPTCVGVSGPAIIPHGYRSHRPILKYQWIHRRFLDAPTRRFPGRFSRHGAISLQASRSTCRYEGPVHYLEACNMSFKTEAIRSVGGFDERYRGIGDWSEPDLCFRLREKFGECLLFTPKATLYHLPSTHGAFSLRYRPSSARLENFNRFSRDWLHPSWLYQTFVQTYYRITGC